MKAKSWVIVKNFQGEPKDGDLEIKEEELPELKDGDVLLEAEYWTVDPYMRPGNAQRKPGDGMQGQFYGRITESKNPDYPVGKALLGSFGWRTHFVFNPSTFPKPPSGYTGVSVPAFSAPPETGDIRPSVTLGVMGMPGATAYFGFLELCQPKAGETVLVSGAAGAVGSIVGQIAKIKGCKVIGFAGSDDKVSYLKEIGFDEAFNYKTVDTSAALKKAAPQGIDCYFDNVGGTFTTDVIINHMNVYGRMSICGCISRYNDDPMKPSLAPELYGVILFKQLSVRGFIVYRWFDKFNEGFKDILQWIQEGKLKYREHVTDGFENMYTAFRGLLKGDNRGKAIIKATKGSEDTQL